MLEKIQIGENSRRNGHFFGLNLILRTYDLLLFFFSIMIN
jgi:hypothetical protein